MSGEQGEWCRIDLNGGEPQTLMRCHSSGLPQLYEAFKWKFVCFQTYNLKGIKGKIYLYYFLPSALFLFYCSSFYGMMLANPIAARGSNV